MLQTLINAFKVKDIRAKVWKMLLLLLIFRIGCYIPIPGLDIIVLPVTLYEKTLLASAGMGI